MSGKTIFIAAFAKRYIADWIEWSCTCSRCTYIHATALTSRRLEKLSLHGLSIVFDNTEEGNLREDSIGCTTAWWLRNASRGKREKKEAPYDHPVKWILYPAETFSKTDRRSCGSSLRARRDFIYEQYPITRNLRVAVIIETHLDILPLSPRCAFSQYSPILIASWYLVLRHHLLYNNVRGMFLYIYVSKVIKKICLINPFRTREHIFYLVNVSF